KAQIHYTGSIKFDPAETASVSIADEHASNLSAVLDPRRPVLFGGSTHNGEEEILGRVFVQLRREFPELLLFVAPRHVERAREVTKQLEKLSLGVVLCSEFDGKFAVNCDALVLDRTGELLNWYPIATVVFV